jgi:hypothetical protein
MDRKKMEIANEMAEKLMTALLAMHLMIKAFSQFIPLIEPEMADTTFKVINSVKTLV